MAEAATKNKSLLVIGHQWPEPDATAAGEHMLWLLKGFLRKGFKITFASAAAPGTYEIDLATLGIERVLIRLNDSSFDRFLGDTDFSHVLFDRFLTEEQFSWRVRDNLPAALLLLDTEDLHSLRHSREEAVRKQHSWSVEDWVQTPLFYRELASMFRSDLNLIISNREVEFLTAHAPFLKDKLVYVPFGMDPLTETAPGSFEQRCDFVFLGNGKHKPNLDAITLLKTEIWPLIRKSIAEARLLVYGAYLPNRVLEMDAPLEGFVIKGWASDLGPVLGNARLQLAPLRFGAGIKGKVLKAAQFNLPTMGTSIGFEGITEGHHSTSFVADESRHFAEKAIRLYTDRNYWDRALKLQKQASQPHVHASFDTLADAIDSHKERLAALLPETRMIQTLLQNEAFDRVRYLSRWIEAKEKGKN